MELELALQLLSLPREVGKHPEDGEPIKAGIGRFGPYVQHGKTYASLEAGDEVFTIGLNRAVTLIAERILKGPSKRRFGADPGKPLGEHPTLGAVAVKGGRYGAYVTAGGVNATIPSDKTQETITLEEAIALIDERAAKGGGKPKRGAKKAPAKKAAAKADADASRRSRPRKPRRKNPSQNRNPMPPARRARRSRRPPRHRRPNLQSRSPRRTPARPADKIWPSSASRAFRAGMPSSRSSARIRARSERGRSRASSG